MKVLPCLIGSALTLISFSQLRAADTKVDPGKLPPPAVGKMDFVKVIRPIFERSCIRCHNSNHAGQKATPVGGLRLDLGRDAALESKGAIVPGKSETSRLIHLVAGLDPEIAMPIRKKDRLSQEDVGKLRAWIDQGAVWPSYSPKLPDGYRLVNLFVKEEFPAEGGEKIWAAFVERYERSGLKGSLLVSEKKGKMFLGGGPWEERRAFGWYPYIPADTPKVRLLIPDIVAATVEVRMRDLNEKDGWKVVWSHAGSGSSVLSPELEVGNDAFLALDVRVISDKKLSVGVSNLLLIAATGTAKK